MVAYVISSQMTAGQMDSWTGEQVNSWTGGQVDRWTGGQVRGRGQQRNKTEQSHCSKKVGPI